MKKHLERMPLYHFRGETLASAAHSVRAIATRIGAGAIGIQESIDELGARLDRMSGSLDQADKSSLTARLKEQDHLRGEVARGLASVARAYLLHHDQTKRAAAERLVIILDRYGNFRRKTYDDESAAIDDLVKEFSNATHAPMVALLGLDEWVTLTREANKAFVALMLRRNAERSRRAVPMKVARVAVEEKMEEIAARVESIINLNGIDFSPELALFVKEYNEITRRYKNILKQEQGLRKARRADESADDSTDAPTDPAEE